MNTPTNPIADLLDRAYATMDKSTGMFPQHDCKVCGKPLNVDGNHPAELYAGTYTGLCYACSNGPAYVVPDSELPDGARLVSHPPSCPSWRRDRTTHWSYPDCEDCGGMGAKQAYSRSSMGFYTEFCRACMARVMVRRKANEVQLLRTVASALELVPIVPKHDHGDKRAGVPAKLIEPLEGESLAHAQFRVLVGRVAKMALRMFGDEPTIWNPGPYPLQAAAARLKPSHTAAKRPETIKRHLIAALYAEADEREAKSAT